MEQPKPGTETALEACDYFVDEVIEASSIRGGNLRTPQGGLASICLTNMKLLLHRCAGGSASDQAWRTPNGGERRR